VISIVLLVMALAVAIGGGFRVSDGNVRLSVTSPWAPLALAAGLVALRHVLRPRPTIAARLASAIGTVTAQESWRAAWPAFVVSRATVLIVGMLAVYTFGIPPLAPRLRISDSELVNLPVRWDAGWYLSIARNGYMWTPRDVGRQQNVAFFPALPMAMRVVGRIFGASGIAYIYGGVVISLVAFLWALMLLYQLARDDLGEPAAAGAVLLLASYPFSVFHGAVYTESLFLLAALGAVLEFRHNRWGHAILWGLLAGLTRPNGCLLALTLATLALTGYLARRRTGSRRVFLAGELAAIGAPVLGAAIYWLFLWQFTGSPFRWSEQHEAWGRTFEGFAPIVAAGDFAAEHGIGAYIRTHPEVVMNAVPSLFALAAAIPIGMRLGWAYSVFIVSNLLPPLMVGGFMSTGRLTSTLFPLFVWLGALTGRATPLVVLIFAMLQGLIAALFYCWRPPY
jgi:hypothetical protein